MTDWPSLAARNNAEWCHLACQACGISGRFSDDVWTCAQRTPAGYPDAVTLGPATSTDDLVGRIDRSPGCSVKDSFAALDLTTLGFTVLFDATWIVLPETPETDTSVHQRWTVVADDDEFAAWRAALTARQAALCPLPAAITRHPDIVVMAQLSGDDLVGGAIFNRSAAVVGLSNVFTAAGPPSETWSTCLACAAANFPGLPLVGYESGPSLDHARAQGFVSTAPLRVWILADGGIGARRAPAGD